MVRIAAVMASLAAVVLLAITVNLVISKLTLSRSESKVRQEYVYVSVSLLSQIYISSSLLSPPQVS